MHLGIVVFADGRSPKGGFFPRSQVSPSQRAKEEEKGSLEETAVVRHAGLGTDPKYGRMQGNTHKFLSAIVRVPRSLLVIFESLV
ncbi:hypothetical protein U0070_019123 [Myodes glareolus]|uniref:Uncharacterized protein n=1 Tax=Myodes glareolus TaxID=447135 RepID=A0AAW0HCS9_MYOGA